MSAESPERAPTILFDGVCNLCNASVQWIIRHDRRSAFRFAALQSEAARRLLAESPAPAALPDSIVLIDADGAHTRSDAVIRIARRLGLPWSLAAAAAVLPRGWRDELYGWVARNRYRWFGRQNTCMTPTAELRGRFLDADEARPAECADAAGSLTAETANPQALGTAGATPSPGAWPASAAAWEGATRGASGYVTRGRALAALLHRVILTYLFIYIFPFPLGWIPGTEGLAEAYEGAKQVPVVWVGKALFGLEITIFPAGSGDTTYNYVELFAFAVLALAAGGLWTAVRRGRPVSQRVSDLMNVYVRYTLGATMLSYGWHKVIPIQMPFPGPDRLLGTFGDASPMGLLWTLMGVSPAYQMFAGAGEVIGGALLLWRRTTLLGALVCAGVLANVVALNFCFDVPVKLYSSHLLLMALFLIAPHTMRLAAVLVLNLPAAPVELRPFPLQQRWVRWVGAAAKVALILLLAVWPIFQNYGLLHEYGALAPRKPWHGLYRVESFVREGVADRALPDGDRWVRVGLASMGVGAIQRADGGSRRQLMQVDADAGTLTITRRGEPEPSVLRFSQPEPGVIVLEGPFEGATISARLRLEEGAAPLLTTRGFHWINEFPLNR